MVVNKEASKTRKKRSNNKKPIVYISSYLQNSSQNTCYFDFFIQIITELSNFLYNTNLDLIIKIPNTTNATQDKIIEKVFKSPSKYGALLVAPISIKPLSKTLNSIIKDNDSYIRLPIITIDKMFNEKINGIEIPYITTDWFKGGQLAASSILKQFETHKGRINILILRGIEGAKPRIDGFMHEINYSNLRDRCFITKSSEELDFTREEAYNYIRQNWRPLHNKTNAIFACNDEMAIGANEALKEMELELNVKIVGFDGTDEIKKIIKQGNDYIIDTVDVKIRNQIKAMSGLIDLAIENPADLIGRKNEFCEIDCFINSKT